MTESLALEVLKKYVGTWVSSEYGNAQLRVGLNYIRGDLKPQQFYVFMKANT